MLTKSKPSGHAWGENSTPREGSDELILGPGQKFAGDGPPNTPANTRNIQSTPMAAKLIVNMCGMKNTQTMMA